VIQRFNHQPPRQADEKGQRRLLARLRKLLLPGVFRASGFPGDPWARFFASDSLAAFARLLAALVAPQRLFERAHFGVGCVKPLLSSLISAEMSPAQAEEAPHKASAPAVRATAFASKASCASPRSTGNRPSYDRIFCTTAQLKWTEDPKLIHLALSVRIATGEF